MRIDNSYVRKSITVGHYKDSVNPGFQSKLCLFYLAYSTCDSSLVTRTWVVMSAASFKALIFSVLRTENVSIVMNLYDLRKSAVAAKLFCFLN